MHFQFAYNLLRLKWLEWGASKVAGLHLSQKMELIPLRMVYSYVASKATALDAEDGLLFFISTSAKATRSIAKTVSSSNSSDSIHTRRWS